MWALRESYGRVKSELILKSLILKYNLILAIAIEESKDLTKLKLVEFVGSLQFNKN